MFGAAISAATSAKNPRNGGASNLTEFLALGQLGARAAEPNIAMSESYNSAASSPVFPPADQERAAAVFGTNEQRQIAATGFKQEMKEKIIEDISSL